VGSVSELDVAGPPGAAGPPDAVAGPSVVDPPADVAADAVTSPSGTVDPAAAHGLDAGDTSLLGLVDRLAAVLARSDLLELEVQAGSTALILRRPEALAPLVLERLADEDPHALRRAQRPAELFQHVAQHPVRDELAVDEDAVAIEKDRLKSHGAMLPAASLPAVFAFTVNSTHSGRMLKRTGRMLTPSPLVTYARFPLCVTQPWAHARGAPGGTISAPMPGRKT
jgi:hypothetical protein